MKFRYHGAERLLIYNNNKTVFKRHRMIIFMKCNTHQDQMKQRHENLTQGTLKIRTTARVDDAFTYYSLIYCITHIYCVGYVMFLMNLPAARKFLLNSGIETRHVHTGLRRRHILNKSLAIHFYLVFIFKAINLIKGFSYERFWCFLLKKKVN